MRVQSLGVGGAPSPNGVMDAMTVLVEDRPLVPDVPSSAGMSMAVPDELGQVPEGQLMVTSFISKPVWSLIQSAPARAASKADQAPRSSLVMRWLMVLDELRVNTPVDHSYG